MWWVPLITGCLLGLVLLQFHGWQQRKDIDKTKIYRARYMQLVSQLESMTMAVNRLAEYMPRVKESKILDYYESCLKTLELILGATKSYAPFGHDPSTLNSALYLVKDCRSRIDRTYKAFADSVRGKNVSLDALYGRNKKLSPTGCYFCSRPLMVTKTFNTKVKIDGEIKKVICCSICKDELDHTKKVKVLFFMKDGKQVHWSELPDYKPTEDFWNLNNKNKNNKNKRLTLIYSKHSAEDLRDDDV